MISNFLITLAIFVVLFCVILLFLVLIYFLSGLISIIFGAPYIPLSKKSINEILTFGNLSSDDSLYDLGCGDGRILMSGLSDFKVSKAVGYEIAPWPYFKTMFLIKYNRIKRIELFNRNGLKADINQATFIYLYLFPKLIDKMAYKIAKDGISIKKILCVQFPIDTNRHTKFQLLKSRNIDNLTIYLYKLKAPL